MTTEAGGRPSLFSKELTDTIITRMIEGESLRAICRDDEMPVISTVLLWMTKIKTEEDPLKKEFSEQYEEAKELRAESLFEEMFDIADNSSNDFMQREDKNGDTYDVVNPENIQRSRLRVDTRKWALSKMVSKKFGDKTEHSHKVSGVIKKIGINADVTPEVAQQAYLEMTSNGLEKS